MNRLNKKIIILSIIFSTLATNIVSASNFIDMPNNWSTGALKEASHYGILEGYNNEIFPNKPLTRAELASSINRALGIEKKANISKFKDVSKKKWYYDDMAKAVYSGLYQGDGNKLHPDRYVTREEVFAVLARAFVLDGNENRLNKFKDGDKVSNWAIYGINGLLKGDYIYGDHRGYLNPRARITRAEYAVLMDSLVQDYIKKPGIYNILPKRGNILINVPNATLKDMTLLGDLIIADGVDDDEVVLSNMDIRGRLLLRGSSLLKVIDNTRIAETIVVNRTGDSHIYVEKGSKIKEIIIKSKTKVEGDGEVEKIIVQKGGDGSEIHVDNVQVIIEEGVKNVTDKHGDEIPSGSHDIGEQGGVETREEALRRLNNARNQAKKMKNTELNEFVKQYSKVGKDSTLKEIINATNSIESKIQELKVKIIAKLKSYEPAIRAEIKKIKKQDGPIQFEREINKLLKSKTTLKAPAKGSAQFILVEDKFEITLEESGVEHVFDYIVTDNDFKDPEKVELYNRLVKAMDRSEKINNVILNEFVAENKYLELRQSVERELIDITADEVPLKLVRKEVEALENQIKETELRIQNRLLQYKEDMITLVENYKNLEEGENIDHIQRVIESLERYRRTAEDGEEEHFLKVNIVHKKSKDDLGSLDIVLEESVYSEKFNISLTLLDLIGRESELLWARLQDTIRKAEKINGVKDSQILDTVKGYNINTNLSTLEYGSNLLQEAINEALRDTGKLEDNIKLAHELIEDGKIASLRDETLDEATEKLEILTELSKCEEDDGKLAYIESARIRDLNNRLEAAKSNLDNKLKDESINKIIEQLKSSIKDGEDHLTTPSSEPNYLDMVLSINRILVDRLDQVYKPIEEAEKVIKEIEEEMKRLEELEIQMQDQAFKVALDIKIKELLEKEYEQEEFKREIEKFLKIEGRNLKVLHDISNPTVRLDIRLDRQGYHNVVYKYQYFKPGREEK